MTGEEYQNSYRQVRSTLSDSLENGNHSVIVLRGRWGTGKTHLWRELHSTPIGKQEIIGRAIYVSLFGLKTIESLKWSILRNAYPTDKKTINKLIQTGAQLGGGFLSRFIGGMSTFNSALLWLPDLLSGRLVVIDDVERKHNDLYIDELLGFLEEFTELHSTRFLLLMNDSKLNDEPTWRDLREKVVDIEIILDPTPIDAVTIASKGIRFPQFDRVQLACNAIGITNIRIIRKAISVVSTLSESVGQDLTWNPWVQSAVLLTVMHFRGIDDPPTIEYVRGLNQTRHYLRDSNNPLSEQEMRWGKMLSDLNIHNSDAFEELVINYLETGFLDKEAIRALFARYRHDDAEKESYNAIHDFFKSLRWDPFATKDSLCAKAESLLDYIDRLSPETASALADTVTKLGNTELSQKIVDNWIRIADTNEALAVGQSALHDQQSGSLHPSIASKVDEIRARKFPPKSLREAIERIALRDAWGEEENRALGEATAYTYRLTLEELTGDELRRFIQVHAQFIRGENTIPAINIAKMNFIKACRSIVESPPSTRLSEIIQWSFKQFGILDNLASPEDHSK